MAGWSVSSAVPGAGGWGTSLTSLVWLPQRDLCQRHQCGACTVPKLAGGFVSGGIPAGTAAGVWGGGEAASKVIW